MLQADVDENGETLKVYWAFDNDSTKYSGYSYQDSSDVTTGGDIIQKYITGSAMNTGCGDSLDYMFWWVGGTDAEGNAPDGKPVSGNRMVYVVNPTMTVLGVDLGTNMMPNSTDNEITQLQLTAEMPGAEITLTRVDFSKTSTSNATTTHISAFKLWNDVNQNGVYDDGTDTQLGSTVTGTVNPSFTSLSINVVNGTTTFLLLTVDVSPAATDQHTLGIELTSDNVFVLQDNVDDVYPSGGSWPQPAAAGDYTLPVEISEFSIRADFGYNDLVWRTESEINSMGFRVWRAPAEEAGLVPTESAFTALADWHEYPGLAGQEITSEATDYDFRDREIEPGTLYCYRLEAVDLDGSSDYYEVNLFVESLAKPASFDLRSNYPNPFNPNTTISFVLPQDSRVELKIFNLRGELVNTLLAGEELGWGRHRFTWDGTNLAGSAVASGTYIYRVRAGAFEESRKMVLLK